ncbi:MarR family transcriptional regulator [Streptomyces californicus]|uniref:MarR family transcriptional regulator n=1 Tax=Streptomyces californicus TaxID=67351 RepID=UPI001E61FEFC|nr:MarR family transcriptional regulator [Streptomyces californicus]MCC0578475.1 MarR family transcriptional regulator [Streptomyces californicus]
MATQHHSPVPSAPVISHAYPMAKPGYGKRNAPDQRPPARDDFALLPARERYVAGFIDRLPQGAAMSVKQLAKHLPLYGQQAIGTSLNSLSVAGHLRRVRSRLTTGTGTGAGAGRGKGGEVRWISRTFWSRTARDNEWWNAYLATEHCIQAVTPADVAAPPPPRTPPPASPTPWDTAEEPQQPPAPRQAPPLEAVAPHQRAPLPAATGTPRPHHTEQQPQAEDMAHVRPAPSADRPEADQTAPRTTPPAPGEVPATLRATIEPVPSDAYLALARLGRDDHRLALSAADCTTLEPLATAWLARGVTVDYLTTALTAGLPAHIDSPAGLLHRRLTDKIPPHIPRATEDRSPDTKEPTHEALLVECTNCRRPGPPQALPDGLCRPCHHAHTHGGEPTTPTPDEVAAVKAHIANLRNLLKPV